MGAAGVELLADLNDLAVMGFIEVAGRLPYFLRLRKRVYAALVDEGVDLVIPIDYPGFNLRLARHARRTGLPVLYYIAPQVWAWHASRARELARDADRIAVILPFEEEFLRGFGATVEFVGHPLLDRTETASAGNEWFDAHGVDPGRPLLALMPGSRLQEVKRHLELFAAAAERVQARRPEVQVMIGAPPAIDPAVYDRAGHPFTRRVTELLAHATAALVKSGTTTLETALAETPFVVAYRMNSVSFQLARRVVRVPHIALANLVAGRRLVPEFVQDAATPAALAEAVLPLLDPTDRRGQEMRDGLREVRQRLGRGGAARRVAEVAAELLSEGLSLG
jgi:lipid-A-disaccharide synthase